MTSWRALGFASDVRGVLAFVRAAGLGLVLLLIALVLVLALLLVLVALLSRMRPVSSPGCIPCLLPVLLELASAVPDDRRCCWWLVLQPMVVLMPIIMVLGVVLVQGGT